MLWYTDKNSNNSFVIQPSFSSPCPFTINPHIWLISTLKNILMLHWVLLSWCDYYWLLETCNFSIPKCNFTSIFWPCLVFPFRPSKSKVKSNVAVTVCQAHAPQRLALECSRNSDKSVITWWRSITVLCRSWPITTETSWFHAKQPSLNTRKKTLSTQNLVLSFVNVTLK